MTHSQDMMEYFNKLCKHKDETVRRAASKCMAIYGTPRWKSRIMRNCLADLSWALYEIY